jgi:HD-GYP domain-containing protein (c-di-GMP phosphodiesterase class II)
MSLETGKKPDVTRAESFSRDADDSALSLERKLAYKDAELRLYKDLLGSEVKSSGFASKLERFLDIVLSTVEADLASAFMLDSTGSLVLTASKGRISERVHVEVLDEGAGLASIVVKSGRPEAARLSQSDVKWLKRAGLSLDRMVVAVPFRRRKKITGVIQIIGREGAGEFTKEDRNFLASFTRHFSLVAERAYVFDDLDERVKDFSTLNKISGLLISTLDVAAVRRRVMHVVTSLVNAEAGSLLLVDKEKGELFFEVALGDHGDRVKEIRLKLGDGVAGWVAKYGRPLIVNDVKSEKRFMKKVDHFCDYETRNILCVPIRAKGKVIGVLQAINKLKGQFTDRDLDTFTLFSGQVAIALDNARLYDELKETFFATSEALAEAIEKRDSYTGNHTKRVLHYSVATAKRLKLSEDELERLKLSAILHDVGKIGIDDAILRKQAPLDEAESAEMKKHPMLGAEILKRVPRLKDVIPGTLHHHERVDGTGYPNGFKGDEIPIAARIISVTDTYDAMTTSRPYRKGLKAEVALEELRRCTGTQFDAEVVIAFIEAFHAGEITNFKAD